MRKIPKYFKEGINKLFQIKKLTEEQYRLLFAIREAGSLYDFADDLYDLPTWTAKIDIDERVTEKAAIDILGLNRKLAYKMTDILDTTHLDKELLQYYCGGAEIGGLCSLGTKANYKNIVKCFCLFKWLVLEESTCNLIFHDKADSKSASTLKKCAQVTHRLTNLNSGNRCIMYSIDLYPYRKLFSKHIN